MEYYIDPVTFVTQKSGFESRYIKNLLGLLDEGATISFHFPLSERMIDREYG